MKHFGQTFVVGILERRHSWRHISFDELGELYTSSMFRSMAISLIGIFLPIYLYKLGYPLPTIFLFIASIFAFRCLMNIPSGYLVAAVGPKHVMLYSYGFQIVSLALLLTLPKQGWPLQLIALSWGVASSLFFLAYNVDFSKILHSDHGGKEIGFMAIMERIGATVGPLLGGLIATFIGAQWMILVAIILFAFAVIPLFFTPEPTRTHQHLDFKNFPYRTIGRDAFSFGAFAAENVLTVMLWPLFIGVIIFTTNTYATIGAIASLGTLIAIFSARIVGQLVDQKRGLELLRWATLSNAGLHILRPLIGSVGGVILMNIANELLTTSYRLPYLKGFYSRADELPGYRIVFIVCMEVIGDIGKVIPWLILWALTSFISPIGAMYAGFVIAAIASLLIMSERFAALRR